jgi:hypothetical protein
VNADHRSIVERAVGDTLDETYRALLKQSRKEADCFFAGAVLATLLLHDPLLQDATEAILLTSSEENPRGVAILSEIHQRIQRRGFAVESQPETEEARDAAQ